MHAEYKCSICGEMHAGPPLSWGPDGPFEWTRIPEAERGIRGECGSDQCVIDKRQFFVRGRVEIPIRDTDDIFAWLVWVKVTAEDFLDMSERWNLEGRESTPPYIARLANRLPVYSEDTLGIEVKLHTRPVGERPFVEVVAAHRLRHEQRHGISSAQVRSIADQLLHQTTHLIPNAATPQL